MPLPVRHIAEAISAAQALKSLRPDDTSAAMRLPAEATAYNRTLSRCFSLATPGRNAAMTPLDAPDPIHRRIEQHAARHPQEIAVISRGQRLSYGELNARANRLARYLRRMAPSPATPAGIFMEPCIGTVLCLLAALKAGNSFIPLDPCGPPMRTAAILDETEAFVLLPSESTPACLPARRARAISIENELDGIGCGSAGNLSRSDTEGLSRAALHAFAGERTDGAAVSHRGCLDAMESFRASLAITPADWFVTTVKPDLAFSALWTLTPLVYGARLVLAPAGEEGFSELFFDQIERSHAVVLRATPAIAAAFLSAKWQIRSKVKLICGAEIWPEDLLKTLGAMGIEIWRLHETAGNYELRRDEPTADFTAARFAANGSQA
jgi:non-ribosomal peptide synthetase component F